MGLPGWMNRGKPAGGAALDGKTWKGSCGAAAAELGQGRGPGGAGEKKTLPFIAKLGLLGA